MNGNQAEARRTKLQDELDRNSTPEERNEAGAHATPPGLAHQMLRYAAERTRDEPGLSFLDPAVGTGALYSAFLAAVPRDRMERALGYETDRKTATIARALWSPHGLGVREQDFTQAAPPGPEGGFNLVVCNPPYVRHHHIDPTRKRALRERLAAQGNMKLNGLAGLYAHFIGLAHPWMTEGALAAWLVPSEFMDVNYGSGVREYLASRVTLLHIHRSDPETPQFRDALVSSAVICFRNNPPPERHMVRMTFGGTLDRPERDSTVRLETLRNDGKWSKYPIAGAQAATGKRGATLSDFFDIKRGIATGANSFFIMTGEAARESRIPGWALRPVLPGARGLPHDVVFGDRKGGPLLGRRLFLLDCELDEETLARTAPALSAYLQRGKEKISGTYLCLRRTPWYSQERRPPAPLLCTYMRRARKNAQAAFRFILNHSEATALNVYLMMYPKGPLAAKMEGDLGLRTAVWEALRAISPEEVTREGRVYGGGLRKVEPKELGRVGADGLAELQQ